MVPPGASPHTYDPTPSQIVEVARAEIYAKVGSGIDFELVWMDKLTAQNDDILIVDCSEGVQLIEMADTDEHEEEDHAHGAMDPHIWMSPLNARIMVQNICDGLMQIDPANRSYYEANRDSYLQSLAQLDQDIQDGLSGVTNRTFMVYHPAFGYFAEAYDLTMLPIEAEGKEPTAAELLRLIDTAKENNIKVIFASPQFNPQSAEVIADQIGGSVVFIDPLASDYINNLRTLLSKLVAAME
jgi:zinc transport system substrate-binding protein